MSDRLSRRGFLAGTATVLAVAGFGQPAFADPQRGGKKKKPKNIIFCVADGMAMQTLALSDVYQKVELGHHSYWHTLSNHELAVNGLQVTRSLNSIVTDSSAASSTWGSGRRIWNGQVNEFPDGTKLKTLYQILQAEGMRTGLVTTTTITHATPAGFAINCPSRDDEQQIARRYLELAPNVLMGGGNRHFDPTKRKDKVDLYGKFQSAGYTVARSKAEIAKLSGKHQIGIFSDSHLPFTVDHRESNELRDTVPTLAEMARHAIQQLKGSKEGFILQIEGGKVDHAAHANDLAGMIFDQIAFEEAVKVAVEFALNDGETLVVVTADHATGGPSLNGDGDEYIEANDGLKTISKYRSSFSPMIAEFGKSPTASHISDVVQAKLGIGLTVPEAQAVADAAVGKSPLAVLKFANDLGGTLAAVLGNHSRVCWTSHNHTHEHVMVTAIGPGSELFAGVQDNTNYFHHLLSYRGLKHTNPSMSFEDAMRIRESKKTSALICYDEA